MVIIWSKINKVSAHKHCINNVIYEVTNYVFIIMTFMITHTFNLSVKVFFASIPPFDLRRDLDMETF